MHFSFTKHHPKSESVYPMLDGYLSKDETLVVDLQRRANGKSTLYLHIGAATFLRITGDSTKIIEA